jgi:hypothetical protein
MKKIRFIVILIVLLTNLGNGYSQNENTLAKEGSIILEDNKSLPFINVKLIDGNFHYTDIKSGNEKQISINEVKYIIDRQNSYIFTNKSVVDRAKINEEKLFVKQKLEKLQLEESRKLKLVPDGIYYTKENFLGKNPNSLDTIVPKGLYGFEKSVLYDIPETCFFYYKKSDKKIKNVFAISYQGHLYFQIQAILSNRNKTDRAQTNDFPNSFTRVISAGENYYYCEANLVNGWAQGLAYGGIGGAAGGIIAQNMINLKGIVWDIKNKEFNIFKNCTDYNSFIKNLYHEGIQECKKHQADIIKIREAIEIIK